MADYILRADSTSTLAPGKVYLCEDGSWSKTKLDAKVFTAKTRATEGKKAADLECEIIAPDFATNQAVEDAVWN